VAATHEHVYRYSAESACTLDEERADLRLFTSQPYPRFFEGWVADPLPHAAALLLVARTARTSFWNHTDPRTLDPVVTCHADRLRFEAFSNCCGVYVRYDVGIDGLDGELFRPGATNIDVNPPLRAALGRLTPHSSLHLGIGPGDVTVMTQDGAVVERKVDLPVRWVKGFGEVGVAQAALEPRMSLSGAVAQRFLRDVPRGSDDVFLLAGPRWSRVDRPGAVRVGSAQRLRVLEPFARHAERLVVFGGADGVSAFVLETGKARLHAVLSPAAWRGFSGEGGVLEALASEELSRVAEEVEDALRWQPALDPRALAEHADADTAKVRTALEAVAARGRAGFDLGEGAYFHRDLPFDLERVEALHPRLRNARALVGEVQPAGPGEFRVRDHTVRLDADPPTCTCLWWARHAGARGPCKHVLAAQLWRS
jgi:hypothetical protein